ncbi:MAG: amidohydrolase family protein [Candidatus Entotheonellia bacterium]
MDDYCGAFPERLTGVILVAARDVARGVKEIAAWAKKRWPLGLFVYAPYGTPLDHPDREPFWEAAQAHDLAVVLHTFTVMPPYAPAAWIPGTICGCSVRPRIPGVACAIWLH